MVSVVIPLLDEVENVPELLRRTAEACAASGHGFEIVAVDDGSTDGTLEALRAAAKADPRVRYVALSRNYGQTAAISAGLDAAQGEYVVTMDGDLQNDPGDIPLLVSRLEQGYDVVSGWRKKRSDPFWTKTVPSRLANRLIRLATDTRIHDSGCTLKAYRREILSELRLYGEMHRFIPALLQWKGARLAEVEVRHHPRRHGRSKYGLSRLSRVLLDLATVKFLLSYSTRPVQFFGRIGLYSFAASLLSLAGLVAMKVGMAVDMTGNPLLLLTAFLAFAGLQFVTMGLLGEINMRTYHETTGRRIYRVAEQSGVGDAPPGRRDVPMARIIDGPVQPQVRH